MITDNFKFVDINRQSVIMSKRTTQMFCCVLILILSILSLSSSDGATTQSPSIARSLSDIGNPQTDVNLCGRNGKPSYVCDPDHVLSVGQDDLLDSLIQGIRNSTQCPCTTAVCQTGNSGYLVAIAIIYKINLPTSSSSGGRNDDHAQQLDTILSEAKKLAVGILQKWNFGRCGESAVILFSRADNVLYTVTDVVAERKLTNDIIGEIAMDVRSDFGQNITTGFQKLLAEYKSVFTGQYTRKTNWDEANLPQAYPVIGASGNSLIIYIYFYTLVTIIVTVLMQL